MQQDELQEEFELDDILREFGTDPAQKEVLEDSFEDTISLEELKKVLNAEAEEAPAEEELSEQTLAQEAPSETQEEAPTEQVPLEDGDTRRFEAVQEESPQATQEETIAIGPVSEETKELSQLQEEEGPTVLRHPRTKLQEMRRKIVEGPERQYYALRQKGLAKVQVCLLLSLFVAAVSVGTTVLYAMGQVEADRMRLLVFGQLFMLLMSALLGVFQMIDGIFEVRNLRFTPNTLLAFTFAACCVDCVGCLQTLRVPCSAVFCVQVVMTLWGDYLKRKTNTLRMDTMRRASKLVGLTAEEDYFEGRKGILRGSGDVDDFMDTHEQPSAPEKLLSWYCLVAFAVAIAAGVTAGVQRDVSFGVQITAAAMLTAMPATIFITVARPASLLEKRLHSLGTVLCGWQGVQGLSGKAVFPLTHRDLFPEGTVKLNGVKFYGELSPATVVSYAAAVAALEKGTLASVLEQLRESHNAPAYEAESIKHYTGGIGGGVEGEVVLVGTLPFLKSLEIFIPPDVHMTRGLGIAIGGAFSCLLAVNYERTRAAASGLQVLTSYHGLSPLLVSQDLVLTGRFLQNKLGVSPKKFLRPEPQVRDELQARKLQENAPVLALVTKPNPLAFAYTVAGARAYRVAAVLGAFVHILGGIAGLAAMVVIAIIGAAQLLTPWNLLLYQAIWLIPGLLLTEWTRAI